MDYTDVIDETQGFVDKFSNSMDEVQRGLYNRVSALLKNLTIDGDGMIKQTAANLKIINQVKAELDTVVNNPVFQDTVSGLQSSIDDISKLQNDFYSDTISDYTEPNIIGAYQTQAFSEAVDGLTLVGVNPEALGYSINIVSTGIKEGQSFATMADNLRLSMLGDAKIEGRLVSYAKGIALDTLNGTARNYNAIVTEKLDMQWFEYVGDTKDTTRPICLAAVKKRWFHKSELVNLAKGIIDGRQISRAGMMPGTTGENICSRCGGYNCEHHLVGVSEERVPKKIRDNFVD